MKLCPEQIERILTPLPTLYINGCIHPESAERIRRRLHKSRDGQRFVLYDVGRGQTFSVIVQEEDNVRRAYIVVSYDNRPVSTRIIEEVCDAESS